MGKDLNRALRDGDGEIYDIIAGDFLVVFKSPGRLNSMERRVR